MRTDGPDSSLPTLRVAFIGLGAMGLPMARRIRDRGIQVEGYHPLERRARDLSAAGIPTRTDLRSVVQPATVVATMLPGPREVRQVLSGPGGVLSLARSGTVVVDFSTVGPEVAVEHSRDGALRGIQVLDAPVSGGVKGAIEGTLVVMVGGAPAALEAARPVLEALARQVEWVGDSGAGQVVKEANQLVVAGTLSVLAEAIALLRAGNVDLETGLRLLSAGQAGSTILLRKTPMFVTGDFSPQFKLALMAKDLGLVRTSAEAVGLRLPLAEHCARTFASAAAAGYRDLDCAAVIKQVPENARWEPGAPGR
ncbi:MAG: NAD(P)-dependent oxidoreductase [Candidatus Dormibacteraeota bacterium]|nr:NAD(P)-dependent oxidoreductase [Candidatus Dormibacteraeota bacterium]